MKIKRVKSTKKSYPSLKDYKKTMLLGLTATTLAFNSCGEVKKPDKGQNSTLPNHNKIRLDGDLPAVCPPEKASIKPQNDDFIMLLGEVPTVYPPKKTTEKNKSKLIYNNKTKIEETDEFVMPVTAGVPPPPQPPQKEETK